MSTLSLGFPSAREPTDISVAGAIAAIGVSLRAPLLTLPVWKDEQITIELLRRFSPLELVTMIPVLQPHYPTYYVAVDAVLTLTPIGPVALGRGLSVLTGALTPAVLYLWLLEHVSRSRSIEAAAIVGLSPVVLKQSAWFRMYAPLLLAVTLSWWFACRHLGDGSGRAYAVAGSTAALLHPFGAVITGLQVGWVWVESRLSRTAAIAKPAVAAVATAVVIGGLETVWRLLSLRAQTAGATTIGSNVIHPKAPTRPLLRALVLPITTLSGTTYLEAQLLVACFAAVGLVGLYAVNRQWSTRVGRAAGVWVFGAVAALVLVNQLRPVLMLKYVAWIAPGVGLILANSEPDVRRRVVVATIVGLVVIGDVMLYLEHRPVAKVAIDGVGVLPF